jgi:hypothetical protein
MSSEKRKSKRQMLTCESSILSLDRKQTIGCRLRDISATGAKILVENSDEVPEDFVLMLSERGKVLRLCHVVYRGKKQVGVAFRPRSPAKIAASANR